MTLALINLPTADFAVWLLISMLLAGFFTLIYGGNVLTGGAAAISLNMKVAPIVVGLTVVSITTSMPEMATSLISAKDNPGIALGNILGSNIANIGLVLGVAAMIAPLKVEKRMIRRDVPIMIGGTFLFTGFALDGRLHPFEGAVMLLLTLVYLVYIVRSNKVQTATRKVTVTAEKSQKSTPTALICILIGGALLMLGADLLVGSSVEIATRMGASELFIGLTIVAIGTSLPELATSVAAVRAGHGDLCAGNIIGSNLFNVLLIGGAVSAFVGMDVSDELLFVEFPALLLLSVLLLWFFKSGHIMNRREGLCLLLLYFCIICLSALSQFGYIF